MFYEEVYTPGNDHYLDYLGTQLAGQARKAFMSGQDSFTVPLQHAEDVVNYLSPLLANIAWVKEAYGDNFKALQNTFNTLNDQHAVTLELLERAEDFTAGLVESRRPPKKLDIEKLTDLDEALPAFIDASYYDPAEPGSNIVYDLEGSLYVNGCRLDGYNHCIEVNQELLADFSRLERQVQQAVFSGCDSLELAVDEVVGCILPLQEVVPAQRVNADTAEDILYELEEGIAGEELEVETKILLLREVAALLRPLLARPRRWCKQSFTATELGEWHARVVELRTPEEKRLTEVSAVS